MITKAELQRVMPNCLTQLWYDPLVMSMRKYDITTENRIIAFIPSIAYESKECCSLHLDPPTDREGLLKIPRFFNESNVDQYVNDIDAVRAVIYATGPGNMHGSDDGALFYPRGLLKIYGRKEYTEYSKKLDLPLVDKPELCEVPLMSAMISANLFMDLAVKYADNREFQRVQSILSTRDPSQYDKKNTEIRNWNVRKHYYDIMLDIYRAKNK